MWNILSELISHFTTYLDNRGGKNMSYLEVSKNDVKNLIRLQVLSEIHPIKERINQLTEKYKCGFYEFENRIHENEEVFEEWDEYMEWKAYQLKFEELNQKLGVINDAKNIRITE